MNSRLVVIGEIFTKNLHQMFFVPDEHMVQTLTSDRANDAFSIGSLPRRLRRNKNFLDAQVLDPLSEMLAIDRIPVSDQVFRSRLFRKGIDDLLGRPHGGRMDGNVKMHDLPPMMAKNNKAEQDLEPDRRDGKEIDGDDLFCMVSQKGSPRLGRWPSRLDHVLGHCGFGDLMAQQMQFRLNARSTPERILF